MEKTNEIEGTLMTQVCKKCYYRKEDKENYSVIAIIRSYDHKGQGWRMHTLDSLLEASDNIEDIEEFEKHLKDTYEVIEELSLEDFFNEVIKTSKELNRWGY